MIQAVAIVSTAESIRHGSIFHIEDGLVIFAHIEGIEERREQGMKWAKRGILYLIAAAMLLALSGCSSSSSYGSSTKSSSYDEYDRKYSKEELSGFVNEYKDTLGW